MFLMSSNRVLISNYHKVTGIQKLVTYSLMLIQMTLSTELQQFHSYVFHKSNTTKKTCFTHTELHKTITEDKLDSAFQKH